MSHVLWKKSRLDKEQWFKLNEALKIMLRFLVLAFRNLSANARVVETKTLNNVSHQTGFQEDSLLPLLSSFFPQTRPRGPGHPLRTQIPGLLLAGALPGIVQGHRKKMGPL